MTTTPTTTSRNPIVGVLRRVAIAVGLVAALRVVAGGVKKRHIVRRFEGKTPSEAHETILTYATRRTGDPEKAARLADRMVERLESRGVLAPEASGSAA